LTYKTETSNKKSFLKYIRNSGVFHSRKTNQSAKIKRNTQKTRLIHFSRNVCTKNPHPTQVVFRVKSFSKIS